MPYYNQDHLHNGQGKILNQAFKMKKQQVFRLPHAGAGGGRTIPSLKKHIVRREIRYIDPEKNNQNLCFFLTYSFITMPDIKAEGSAIPAKHYKEHSLVQGSPKSY
ncbi:MAG: hypothetical protein EZS28_002636 [Streblomastix strix]|uniref:Uncharacterized protein n=1 Tax=Streblomastix strix TaxID=222440 RepID=A0A5J4X4E0_9EUKA|nr:MAG: hypothetical protein EZS28_002636 [Streblomastix strix]